MSPADHDKIKAVNNVASAINGFAFLILVLFIWTRCAS